MLGSREDSNRKMRAELLLSIQSMSKRTTSGKPEIKATGGLERVLDFRKPTAMPGVKNVVAVKKLDELQSAYSEAFHASTDRLMKFGTGAVVNNSRILGSRERDNQSKTRSKDKKEKSAEKSVDRFRSTSKELPFWETPRLTVRSKRILDMIDCFRNNLDTSIDRNSVERGSVSSKTAERWIHHPSRPKESFIMCATHLDNRPCSEIESNIITRKGSFRDFKLSRSASKDHGYHTEYNLEGRKSVEPAKRHERGIDALITERKFSHSTQKHFLESFDPVRHNRKSVDTLPVSQYTNDRKKLSPSRERLREAFDNHVDVEYELRKVGHSIEGGRQESSKSQENLGFFGRSSRDQKFQLLNLNNRSQFLKESSESRYSPEKLKSLTSIRPTTDLDRLHIRNAAGNFASDSTLNELAADRLFGSGVNESELVSPISYDPRMKSTIISIENCQDIQKLVSGVSLRPLELNSEKFKKQTN